MSFAIPLGDLLPLLHAKVSTIIMAHTTNEINLLILILIALDKINSDKKGAKSRYTHFQHPKSVEIIRQRY